MSSSTFETDALRWRLAALVVSAGVVVFSCTCRTAKPPNAGIDGGETDAGSQSPPIDVRAIGGDPGRIVRIDRPRAYRLYIDSQGRPALLSGDFELGVFMLRSMPLDSFNVVTVGQLDGGLVPEIELGWRAEPNGVVYQFSVLSGIGYNNSTERELRFAVQTSSGAYADLESCGTPIPTPAVGSASIASEAWVGFPASCESPCGGNAAALYRVADVGVSTALCLFGQELGGYARKLYLHPFSRSGATVLNGQLRFFDFNETGVIGESVTAAPSFAKFRAFYPHRLVAVFQQQVNTGPRGTEIRLIEASLAADGGIVTAPSPLGVAFSDIAALTRTDAGVAAIGRGVAPDGGAATSWAVAIVDLSAGSSLRPVALITKAPLAQTPIAASVDGWVGALWLVEDGEALEIWAQRVN